MADNRIISKKKYIVNGVVSSTTDNNLTKRPYNTNTPISNNKKQPVSDSFNDTLNSVSSHNLHNDNSTVFSDELENILKLKSEEHSRLIQAKFNNTTLNDNNSNGRIVDTELHNKLSDAMAVEVDISTLYKKIELLNSLKEE